MSVCSRICTWLGKAVLSRHLDYNLWTIKWPLSLAPSWVIHKLPVTCFHLMRTGVSWPFQVFPPLHVSVEFCVELRSFHTIPYLLGTALPPCSFRGLGTVWFHCRSQPGRSPHVSPHSAVPVTSCSRWLGLVARPARFRRSEAPECLRQETLCSGPPGLSDLTGAFIVLSYLHPLLQHACVHVQNGHPDLAGFSLSLVLRSLTRFLACLDYHYYPHYLSFFFPTPRSHIKKKTLVNKVMLCIYLHWSFWNCRIYAQKFMYLWVFIVRICRGRRY